jgi:hypothetical protein
MRLHRTHLVPVLAIVAGGVIGASLSFSLLGSRSDDVVFVAAPVAPSASKETARRLEPLARETAEQQLADAVRRLEDHAAAMRRAPAGLITLEVPEGYMRLSSFTDWQGLLEVAETYVRLSDFRDEEQQRLPEVAETYIRFSDLRDEEQQRLPEVAETYIRWSDALQFRNQHFLEVMERQVEVERRRVEFAIANDVTVLPKM